MSDSLWPHEPQHTRPPWPSPTPGVYPNSCPLQRRQWHPTPVLLPGKSHGRRSLVRCSPWGREVRHDWATSLSLFTFMNWRRKWKSTQCSCLENPRDSGAWWAAVYGVTQSRKRLKWLSSSSSSSMSIESVMPSNYLTLCRPFFSCLQSFPASGSFQMSHPFSSVGQSIGISTSTSVLPMNTQDWSLLGLTGWISLQSKGLSRVFSNTTV